MLVFLPVLCLVLFYGLLRLPVPDESTILYEGWRISTGQVPYRDFFDFIWPGSFFLGAMIIKLLGQPSIIGFRLVALFALVGCAAITFDMGRRFLPKRWLAWLAVFLWITYVPEFFKFHHHIISQFMGMLAIWFLFQHVSVTSRKPGKNLILSGVLTGATLLTVQSVGGLLCLALTLFVGGYHWHTETKHPWKTALKALAIFWAPIMLMVCLLLAYLGFQGALADFWYDTYVWLWEGYSQATFHTYFAEGFANIVGYIRRGLWHPEHLYQAVRLTLQGVLPVLGFVWLLDKALRLMGLDLIRNSQPASRYSQQDWQVLAVWFGGMGLLLASFSYPTSELVAYHGWLIYLLAIIALVNLFRHFKIPRVLEYRVILVTVMLLCVGVTLKVNQSFSAVLSPRIPSYGTLEQSLVGGGSSNENELINLIESVHAHTQPGDGVFMYNLAPEFYFLVNRQNPLRYQYLIANYSTSAQIEEAAADLEKKRPKVVVYNHLDEFYYTYDYRFKDFRDKDFHLLPIQDVIQQLYYPVFQGEKYSVFALRAVSPALQKSSP
ncbi:MAG: hypothetical protein KTR14_07860 [Vampirovibrio sp.]|nr:hypothetical protein [Vampirovibrio sp.]